MKLWLLNYFKKKYIFKYDKEKTMDILRKKIEVSDRISKYYLNKIFVSIPFPVVRFTPLCCTKV